MSFKRQILPKKSSFDLTAQLVGIGMNFFATPSKNPNIEDTIFFAALDGLVNDNFRTLSVLTTWIEIHFSCINVDRLTHLIAANNNCRIKAYFSSLAKFLHKDRRFLKMEKLYNGPRIDLIAVGSDFHIARYGEDERFKNGALRVPANTLRRREKDVLSQEKMSQLNRNYYWRMIIGPSYRADFWATLEMNSTITSAELARQTYGSFAGAWKAKKDWAIIHLTEVP